MKQILFLILTILLASGLAACGKENSMKDYQFGNDPTGPEENDSQNNNNEIKDTVVNDKEKEAEQPLIPTEKENEQSDHESKTSPETSIEKPNEQKDYEIVHEKDNGKFPVAFVTVASENSDQLKLIAQELKTKYPKNKVIGVNIIFFTEDNHQEAMNQNSDHAFAKLTVNHKGNVSKLIFFNNQKPIHIQ